MVVLIHKAKVVGEPIVILAFVWWSLFLQMPLLASEEPCLVSFPQGKFCPFQYSGSRDWLSQQMLADLFKCQKTQEARLGSGPTLSSILCPATSKSLRRSRNSTKLKNFAHCWVNHWLEHWEGAQAGGAPAALIWCIHLPT